MRAQFRNYLISHNCRQTSERFAILEAIYDIDGTFTIEDLQRAMERRRFLVSPATLYSTTALMVEANVLIQHPFSHSTSVFERIDDYRPRSYRICNSCHLITRIKSRELASSLEEYHPRTFSVSHRIVYVYGTCAACQRLMHRVLKKRQKHAKSQKSKAAKDIKAAKGNKAAKENKKNKE